MMFRVGIAEVFLYLIPAAMGIALGRYLQWWVNLAVMVALLYLGVTVLTFQASGVIRLVNPFTLVLISPGGLLPILLLLLIARIASRRGRSPQ
jgi:hypothetical protein